VRATTPTAGRAFRFGVLIDTRSVSRTQFLELAKGVEARGYATLLGTDHVGRWSSVMLLGAASMVSSRLRVGTFVLNADLRHPILLAQDMATLDMLSGGRLEIGLGAGWMKGDYDAIGLALTPAGARIERLKETVRVVREALERGRVERSGAADASATIAMPMSTQRPCPPILLGGGGPRLLSIAAEQADIISINPRSTQEGRLDPGDLDPRAMDEKIALLMARAGPRWEEVELNANLLGIGVTRETAHGPAAAVVRDMSDEQLATSPHFLPGDHGEIIEELEARRERWSLSYVVVRQAEMALMDPVVKQLAGR
jgi:probable F420-dependent oxidoreductase